jgi:hypothetical protein
MHVFQKAITTDGSFLHRLLRAMEGDNLQYLIPEEAGKNEVVVGTMNLLERSLYRIFRETEKEKRENEEKMQNAKSSEESLRFLKEDDCIRWQHFSAEALLNESIRKRFPDYDNLSLRAPNLIVAIGR